MTVPHLPPWYDLTDAACLSVLIVAMLATVWIYVDRRTPLAILVRTWGRQPRAPAMLFAAISLIVLFASVEAVLDHQEDELLVDLDVLVRDAALAATVGSWVRRAAEVVSDLTWAGLTGAVLTVGIGLVWRRRWREASVLLAGTLGAWALFTGLKSLLRVPRPHALAHHPVAISSYAFPSGHVVMTLVVAGLIIWTIGRLTGRPSASSPYAGALLIASVVGAARIVVDAHWLTDVLASLALGTLWLSMVVCVSAGRSSSPEPCPASTAAP